jgi:preprotein translocase subunit SecE
VNREEKRRLQRQGQLGPDGQPMSSAGAVQDRQRRVRSAGQRAATGGNLLTRTGDFVRETRGELRKVAWPTRLEVRNYSIVVLITLILLVSLIFALDWLFAKSILNLFHT